MQQNTDTTPEATSAPRIPSFNDPVKRVVFTLEVAFAAEDMIEEGYLWVGPDGSLYGVDGKKTTVLKAARALLDEAVEDAVHGIASSHVTTVTTYSCSGCEHDQAHSGHRA